MVLPPGVTAVASAQRRPAGRLHRAAESARASWHSRSGQTRGVVVCCMVGLVRERESRSEFVCNC